MKTELLSTGWITSPIKERQIFFIRKKNPRLYVYLDTESHLN